MRKLLFLIFTLLLSVDYAIAGRDFDGTDDRVRFTSVAAIEVDTLTACVWAYADANDAILAIHREDVADFVNTGWNLYINTSDFVRWGIDAGGSSELLTGTVDVVNAAWHHICGTYDGTNAMELFVDGVSDGTLTHSVGGTVDYGTTNVRLDLGYYTGQAPSFQLDGRLAEFAFWSVVLSDDEIAALAGGTTANHIRAPSLLVYYPLHGLSSTEADLAGEARNGTVTGAIVGDHSPTGPYVRR